MRMKYMIICLAGLLTVSCSGKGSSSAGIESHGVNVDSLSMITPVHAQGFNVSYHGDVTLLDINDPESKEAEQFHFALVDKE
ncbi:MAG: hypothetical protein K2F93_06555 [Muribaculaceae bacterium]|nr:hypothetical protein [Muribaculaceae bacterium]